MTLPETVTTPTQSVVVDRDNSGQIAIGNGLIYQINVQSGGVVNNILPAQLPTIRARSTPVMIRPRQMAAMYDRKTELGAVVEKITGGAPVEFYGENGLGKTAVLRALAYHPVSSAFPDGVIYLLAHDQPVQDLIQCLYDAFFEASAPYKPSEAQIRLALNPKRALILLDDFALDNSAIQALMDVAPNSNFVMASKERRLWGEGTAIAIPGLPAEDAEELFRRELGRQTDPAEQQPIRSICERLNGWPLHILQAGALAREQSTSLAELDAYLAVGDPVERLNQALMKGLKKDEKKVVAVLAAVTGAPLPAVHMAELAAITNPEQTLDALHQRGVVEEHNRHFALAGAFGGFAGQALKSENWSQRAFTLIASHLERTPGVNSPATTELIEPALRLMDGAAQAGRWENVIRLGKLLDPWLTLSRRWGAWEKILQQTLSAASALGDQAVQAWAMHQLGTRALCQGDLATARDMLVKALRMRRMLGDNPGAQITRHNLDLIIGGGGFNSDRGGKGGGGSGARHPFVPGLLGTLVLVAVLAVVFLTAHAAFDQHVPPTGTLTSKATRLPAFTATRTPSAAPRSTQSANLIPTQTSTLPPTNTPTATPTSTPTPNFTATRTPTPCGPPRGWVLYRVKPGDTLFHLASVTGTSVSQLMLANCLTNSNLRAGQTLYLPHLPPTPTFTPTATFTPTETITKPAPPTNTFTPYYTPAPYLVVSIKAGNPMAVEGGWNVPIAVIVSNQGKGDAQGKITVRLNYSQAWVEKGQKLNTPGSIQVVVSDYIPAGKDVIVDTIVPLDYSWSYMTVNFIAVLKNNKSNEANLYIP